MAPPTTRRSGFSRRAQYGVFTGYVLAGIGALVGAILLAISLINPSAFAGLRTSAVDAAAPVAQATAAGRSERQGLFESVSAYIAAGSENAKLRQELKIARVRLAEARAIKAENDRLRAMLGLVDEEPAPVATARLIGSTAASTRRFAYISAGRAQGVRPGMPVRSPTGLVGRVFEAGHHSAWVLLLTDSESMVPVRRSTDDVVAFAEGRADGTLRLRLINLGINPIKTGDVFVTSGAGGLFRPGIAVAVVSRTTRDGGIARVLSDPISTSFVTVEPVWQVEAARVLAAPASSPTLAPASRPDAKPAAAPAAPLSAPPAPDPAPAVPAP
jgi:rod shape-determining protein MreC